MAAAVARFDALPDEAPEALRVIALALPVDARLLAACVCRSWRAFLADTSLWQVLDLTPAGGVVAERVTENLVRCAVARAAGRLRVISLNCVPRLDVDELLLSVIESDGAELQQVNTDAWLIVEELEAVFAAAPRLQALTAGVTDPCSAVLPVLRNDPPYGPLRVRRLFVFTEGDEDDDVLALAAALAAHESLDGLGVNGCAPLGLNALLGAAVTRKVSWLSLEECGLDDESVRALVRLLQLGSLTKLEVDSDFPDAEDASVLELCAALRACRTLTHLTLRLNPDDGATRRVVTELLDAAAGLPALSELNLKGSGNCAATSGSLAALLRANLPSLHALRVEHCRLGDESLAPLLDGLAANTHLRELDCWAGNDLSEAFMRDRLVPALAAMDARQVLDLTPAGGVAPEDLTEDIVREAVARAAGQLRVLSLDNAPRLGDVNQLLVELVESNGANLRQLNTDACLNVAQLRAVFAAAQRLQALNACVSGRCAELLPVLRNFAPFKPVRVSGLHVKLGSGEAVPDVVALAVAVVHHESLSGLHLEDAASARGLNALVVAAAMRVFSWLQVTNCALDVDSIPALARLLRVNSLTTLAVSCTGFPHAQEATVPVLCAALRACPALTHLKLRLNPLHGANRHTVTQLLDAAAALPALTELDLSWSDVQDKSVAGHAFGVLLGTNLPSLRTLRAQGCHLGDEGMVPLLVGLALNTHLRELDCRGNDVSEVFECDRLEPALAALAARAELDA